MHAAPRELLPQSATPNVGIFYEGPDLPLAGGYLGAHYVENLLGHFGLRGELIRLNDYRQNQVAHYRAAFYIGGTRNAALPQNFLKDVMSSAQPFCWLGMHIDQLLAASRGRRQYGFRYVGYQGSLRGWRIDYKDTVFPEDEFNLNLVEPIPGSPVQIRATAIRSDHSRMPYVLNQGQFWYFAEAPFGTGRDSDRYLVFCDLLHDILEVNHPQQSEALVRIEDISAEGEPSHLRAAADVLSKRQIPFQIATIPVYRDPANNVEMRLSDRPRVVEAIQYMIEPGGTPVMHGWTHQYRATTGDDYELWDGIKNSAIAGDSEGEIVRRIEWGLAELFTDRIFPVAFETLTMRHQRLTIMRWQASSRCSTSAL
jgi:uncharacterized protein YdaL